MILNLVTYHLGAESSFKRQRGKRLSRPPKRIIDEYWPVFKAKNEKKMRKDNCMKLKFARNFRNRLLKCPFLTSKDFTLCLNFLHLNFIMENFWYFGPVFHPFNNFASDFPAALLACLSAFCEIFLKTFRIRLLTTTSPAPDSSKIIFTIAALANS